MSDLIFFAALALYLLHIIALTQGVDDLATTAAYVRRCERWLAARGGGE